MTYVIITPWGLCPSTCWGAPQNFSITFLLPGTMCLICSLLTLSLCLGSRVFSESNSCILLPSAGDVGKVRKQVGLGVHSIVKSNSTSYFIGLTVFCVFFHRPPILWFEFSRALQMHSACLGSFVVKIHLEAIEFDKVSKYRTKQQWHGCR